MKMPDVNILIYAHRVEDPHHDFYRHWLESTINGIQPFALSSLVAVAFVRIVTQPRFVAGPTPLAQAMAFVDTMLASRRCRLLHPGAAHVELTWMLCRRAEVCGKKVADAQHAAVAMEHGCTWVTRDDDFQSFVPSGLACQLLSPPPRTDPP